MTEYNPGGYIPPAPAQAYPPPTPPVPEQVVRRAQTQKPWWMIFAGGLLSFLGAGLLASGVAATTGPGTDWSFVAWPLGLVAMGIGGVLLLAGTIALGVKWGNEATRD